MNSGVYLLSFGHRWRLLFVVLAGLAVLATARADPRASRLYEDALRRYESSDYAGAALQLRNALQIDRRQLAAQLLLGRALLANGEVVGAEVALNEALRLGVSPSEALVPLAEAIAQQGRADELIRDARFEPDTLPERSRVQLLLIKAAAASDLGQGRQALQFVEQARRQSPDSADVWLAEVPVRVRSRELAAARQAAERAVALAPDRAEAAYQRATVAHVGGDLSTALQGYTRTLALDAGHVDALAARAGLYIDTGNFDAAAADVTAGRSAAPRDPRLAYLAALLAERRGDTAEARARLSEVANLLDAFPVSFHRFRPQLLMLGGLAHHGLGQLEKAKPYLELALAQDRSNPVAKLLAQVHLSDGNVSKAVEVLTPYQRSRPQDTQATLLLASAQLSLGQHARASALLGDVLARGDDPQARAMLASSLIGSGRLALGAAELERTLKADPSQIPAGVMLTSLYIASGQSRQAVALANDLVRRRPGNPGLENLLGSAHAAAGDAAQARAAFQRAERLDAGFVDPRLNLARLDIDERRFEPARARLDAILAAERDHVDAQIEQARLASAIGRAEDAQRWLERAVDVAQGSLKPGLQLVEFHLARQRPDLARTVIDKLAAAAPDRLPVQLALARTQLAMNDRTGARSTLTRASVAAGFDAAALVQVARLQLQAGNAAGAVHALDKALQERPDHLQARALSVPALLQLGLQARAEERARSILRSDPRLGLGHGLLGDVEAARGQQAAALQAYRRAHALDNSSESLLSLFAALERSDRAGAFALAQGWLRTRPDDLAVTRALADSYARAARYADARTLYEKLTAARPRDAEAWNNLANLQILLKDRTALASAERALALQPEVPYIVGTAGWAAFHAGQPDRALQLLRDARLRDPGNADARYFLAAVLADQGRADEARRELQALLATGATFSHAQQASELLASLR